MTKVEKIMRRDVVGVRAEDMVAMARAIPGCTRVEDHVLVRAEVLRRS